MTQTPCVFAHHAERTRGPSQSRTRLIALLLLFFVSWSITPAHSQSDARAKGVFLLKQDPNDTKTSKFSASEYLSITPDTSKGEGWLRAETPRNGLLFPRELYVGFIPYPELPHLNVLTFAEELEPYKNELQRLVKSLKEYPQTAPFLTPRIESLRFEIAQLSAGSIRIAGRWVTLAEQKANREAENQRIEAENKRRDELLAKERQLAEKKKREEEQRLAEQQKIEEEQKQKEAKEREAFRAELERKRLADEEREAQRKAERAKEIEAERIAAQKNPTNKESPSSGELLWMLVFVLTFPFVPFLPSSIVAFLQLRRAGIKRFNRVTLFFAGVSACIYAFFLSKSARHSLSAFGFGPESEHQLLFALILYVVCVLYAAVVGFQIGTVYAAFSNRAFLGAIFGMAIGLFLGHSLYSGAPDKLAEGEGGGAVIGLMLGTFLAVLFSRLREPDADFSVTLREPDAPQTLSGIQRSSLRTQIARLGVTLLLIAAWCAFGGINNTSFGRDLLSESRETLLERHLKEQRARQKDNLRVLDALDEAIENERRRTGIARPIRKDIVDALTESQISIMEQAAELERIETQRTKSMKWFFLATGILGIAGLVCYSYKD